MALHLQAEAEAVPGTASAAAAIVALFDASSATGTSQDGIVSVLAKNQKSLASFGKHQDEEALTNRSGTITDSQDRLIRAQAAYAESGPTAKAA